MPPIFSDAKHFAINILSERQKDLSGLFASQEVNKFEHPNWYHGSKKLPILKGNIAHFICENDRLVDAGDHLILIGKVLDHDGVRRYTTRVFQRKLFFS